MSRTDSPRSRFRLLFIVPALALIALLAWALASPIGSSPDDDFHLVSIWCATAAPTQADCQGGSSADSRVVPKILVRAPCFAHDPSISGACQSSIGFSSKPTTLTTRGNFVRSYPPVYYAVMHAFVGSNVLVSAFVIRLVNILLFIGITAALFALLPLQRKPTLVWSWLLTTVPLGLFLIASDNPSAWAIIGVGSLWIALLGFFESVGWRRILLGAVFVVSCIMAAGSRGDSATYAILAIAGVLVLAFSRTRTFLVAAILPVVMAIISALFFLSARQSSSGVSGFHGSAAASAGSAVATPVGPVNPIGLLFSNLVQVPSLFGGIFGQNWGLGWLDTTMPAVTSLGAIACFVAVIFLGLGRLSARKGIVIAAAGLAVWLIPVYVLTAGSDPVGQQVQPRYILPLIVVFAGVALLKVRGRTPILLRRVQWITVASTLAIAQSLALYFTMRRFVNGNAAGGFDLDSAKDWWWSIPFPPMLVFALGSLAYAATIVILIREVSPREAVDGSERDADESLAVV